MILRYIPKILMIFNANGDLNGKNISLVEKLIDQVAVVPNFKI